MLRETTNRRPFIAGARRMLFAAGWLVWAVVCAGALGCGGVQRRLTIRSNPPGALVYIDKYEIGRTPCSVSFTYYGKREFKLVKDGCETLTVDRWIVPPWYQVIGLDFITENLSPMEIRDERTFNFELIPMQITSTRQLVERGDNLRQATKAESLAIPLPVAGGASQGYVVPPRAAPTAPGYPLPPGSFTLPPSGASPTPQR
ncbi:MAG TPA: PEGA domain-containing protein [Pirellulales bacterium]|nr:PEGA domain-containing protein [Pirellulales bacterium]